MKTKNTIKRLVSVALCLAVLSVSLFTGIVASAASASIIDFSQYSGDTSATDDLFDSKLAYYFNSSDISFDYMEDILPTDLYGDLDVWAAPQFGMIDGKVYTNTVYDRIGSMSPKDANGKLVVMKNSHIKIGGIRVGDTVSSVCGAVWVGLRQQTPGKFIDGLYEFNKDQILVRVTNTGITVASGEEINALGGSAENALKEDYKFDATTNETLSTVTAQYKIEVTLVGNKCTVYISDPWDTSWLPKHTYEETVSDDAPSAGYVSFGVGDTGTYAFNNAQIDNLDDSGNPIDFDSANNPVLVSALSVNRTIGVGASLIDAKLPKKVFALDKNGNKYSVPVVWDTSAFDSSESGTVTLNGTVSSAGALPTEGTITVTATINVNSGEQKADGENYSYSFYPYTSSLESAFLTTYCHWDGTYQTNMNFTDLFNDGWGNYTTRYYSDAYPMCGEMNSRVAGLTPLDKDGNPLQLRNFELTLDYRVPLTTVAPYNYGSIWVGFRQTDAGNITNLDKNQSLARITNTGVTVASGNSSFRSLGDGLEDLMLSAEDSAWLATDGVFATVKVKVFGNLCTISIYKTETGEEIVSYSEKLNGTALENGYLTLGIGDRAIQLCNLTIKELNDVETFDYAFQPYSQTAIDSSFVGSWSDGYTYTSDITPSVLFCNEWASYTGRIHTDAYPFLTNWNGELNQRIAGLTPIDANGKPLQLRNFELTFDYRVPVPTEARCGAIWVGFRQEKTGHFSDWFEDKSNQSFVRVSNSGILAASGHGVYKFANIYGCGSEEALMSPENAAYMASDGALVTVKVKVLGDVCTVDVYKTGGEKMLTYTEQLEADDPDYGYLTLGIADRQIHMVNLDIKNLDENGNVVDLTNSLMGDANGDGDVNILDMIKVKKYLADQANVVGICKKNANLIVGADIDANDLTALKLILLNSAK